MWPPDPHERLLAPASQYSVLAGRAHFRHGLRLPLDEHAVIYSPPRGGKTGWLARVVVHYPGPVLSTTTKHDMFELTAAARAGRGPVQVFNPQHIGGIPSPPSVPGVLRSTGGTSPGAVRRTPLARTPPRRSVLLRRVSRSTFCRAGWRRRGRGPR
jgi:hypothetical protein